MRAFVSSILLLFLLPDLSSAAVTVQSINQTRFSRGTGKLLGDAIAQTNTIYGGLAGSCNGGNGSTCNSCESASGEACNTRRIHDSLLFEITLLTDTEGVVKVTTDVDDTQQNLDFTANVSTTIAIPANTTFTVSIPWEEICEKVFSLRSGCVSGQTSTLLSSAQRVRIGVDSDNDTKLGAGEFITDLQFIIADFAGSSAGSTALCNSSTSGDVEATCNFIAYPGDSKIFLEEVRVGCDFPGIDGSGANVEFIRVFYQEASIGFPTLTSGEIADLEVSEDSVSCENGSTKVVSIADSEVTGLENDTTYAFAIGVVDEAFNVGFVTDSDSSGVSTATGDESGCYDPTGDDWDQNCHVATPAEVIGLIEDEFDCFITTATYGSPFRPKVEDFRAFRNYYLKTNWVGQKVMDFYYRNSPPVASWIRQNPEVKPFVRWALWPLWLFAKVCLEYPLGFCLFLMGLLVIRRRPWNRELSL